MINYEVTSGVISINVFFSPYKFGSLLRSKPLLQYVIIEAHCKSWTSLQRDFKKVHYYIVNNFYMWCFGFLGLTFLKKERPFFSRMFEDLGGDLFVERWR